MLAKILVAHRSDVLERFVAKVRTSPSTPPPAAIVDGMGAFLDVLAARLGAAGTRGHGEGDVSALALAHAAQRWEIGFEIDDLIHDYGSLCDAITETAKQTSTPIEIEEYRLLNHTLDAAIADAVAAYVARREAAAERSQGERLGEIVHELRNALATSMLSWQAICEARLDPAGRNGKTLDRSLRRQKDIIDHLVNDVRLRSGELRRTAIVLLDFLQDISDRAALRAKEKQIRVSVEVAPDLRLDADPFLLTSAVMNLALNAIKFTRDGGDVILRGKRESGRLQIEVEDECGGLPPGDPDGLFEPWVQRDSDRAGLGLGLTIARQAVEAHGGAITVRNLPGKGCVFVIRLAA